MGRVVTDRAARVTLGVACSAALAALAAAGGCMDPLSDGEVIVEKRMPIIGGVETSEYSNVVMTQTTTGQCSGTLIAPRVVLTAAHCVIDSIENGQTSSGTVYFGDGSSAWIGQAGIRDMIAHRLYDDGAIRSSDIALIRMRDDAPGGIEPMPYNQAPLDDSFLGAPIVVVGFGVSDGESQTGGGRKRKVELTVDELTDQHLGFGDTGRNICQGDSGGPTIYNLDGTEIVLAVSSFGSNFCMDRSYVARTEVFRDFLDEVVAAWSGPCQNDNNCVTEGCGDFPDPDCDTCGFDGVCASGCAKVDLDCPVTGLAGDLCENNDGCESRSCVDALDDPRVHYCSHECDPNDPTPCDAPLTLCQDDGEGTNRCYFPGISPSAQGAPCTEPGDCRSGVCDPEHEICIEPCGDGFPECPEPFACVSISGGQSACTYSDDSGCGCAAGQGRDRPVFLFLVIATAFIGAVGARRRRRSARSNCNR